MKMRTKSPKAATIALFALSSCTRATSADTAEPGMYDAAEVNAAMASHDAAWNAHDPDALTALFAPDATLVTPSGMRLSGHEALRESFAQPGPTKQTQSTSQIEGVQWLADDLILVDARQTLTGPGTEALGVSEANLVAVMRRVDGEWKIVAARPYVPASR